MPIKSYRPTTPTRRYQTVVSREDMSLRADSGEESGYGQGSGLADCSSTGRVSSRFRGGGHKKAYREIDFKRDKGGIACVVASIEYDPNRSARIALLNYVDGEKRFISCSCWLAGGFKVDVRSDGRHFHRQFAAAEKHPGRHGGSLGYRAQAG